MSDEGLIATMTFPGSLNTASFLVFTLANITTSIVDGSNCSYG